MATTTPGITFVSGETVTPAKLNSAATPTISAIQTADISDNQITTAKIVDANVTDAKLATGAVTGAAGGGKLAASAITAQTAIDALASDDTLLIHDDSNTALRKVTWAQIVAEAQSAGSVLQTVQSVKTSLQTITTAIPHDNTIPQSSEGAEVLTATITPSSNSNKILIRAIVYGSSTVNVSSSIALFKDSDANAIASGVSFYPPGDGFGYTSVPPIEFLHSPSTTSAITYKIRVGPTSGSFYVNGSNGGLARFGGTQQSSLTLQEIKG